MKSRFRFRQKMTFRPQKKITDRAALDQIERLVHRIRNAATRLPDSPGERDERVRRGEKDFWFFARTYLPHHFNRDPAEMHYELVEILQESGAAVVRMPRGYAKTTLAQGIALWCLLYGKRHFVMMVGKSAETAQEAALVPVIECEENERIRQDFGEQRTSWWNADRGYRLKRTQGVLLPVGRGEPVRGRKIGQYRPDLILADDIEDEDLARNPKRVKQLLRWWLGSVLPSLAHGGTAVWLGTSLSGKSAITLLMDAEWRYEDSEEPPLCRRFSYAAENEDGESTWPAHWPIERLQAKKAQIGSTAYNREFLHKPEPVGGIFRGEWLKFYREDELPAGCLTAMAIDPSARAKETSNFKAVGVVSKDLKRQDYFCRHAWIRRESLTAMCTKICDLFELYRPKFVVIETNGYQELVKDELQRVARARGLRLPIVTVEHKIAKEVRIQTLQPIAENGQLHFLKRHSDQDLLVEQLLYYPSSNVEDDGPDMLEMAIEKLSPFRADRQPGRYERVGERRMAIGELL